MSFIALIWLPITYLIVSFVEWQIHRHHMHKKGFLNKIDDSLYTGHAKKHHTVFSPKADLPSQEEIDDIPHSTLQLSVLGLILGSIPLICGWVFDNYDIMIGGPILFLSSIVWGMTWNWLHVKIHTDGWIPSNFVLRFLKKYHDIHHENVSKNYNSLALGWDFIMGTFQWRK